MGSEDKMLVDDKLGVNRGTAVGGYDKAVAVYAETGLVEGLLEGAHAGGGAGMVAGYRKPLPPVFVGNSIIRRYTVLPLQIGEKLCGNLEGITDVSEELKIVKDRLGVAGETVKEPVHSPARFGLPGRALGHESVVYAAHK
jgi:hypothetical protein